MHACNHLLICSYKFRHASLQTPTIRYTQTHASLTICLDKPLKLKEPAVLRGISATAFAYINLHATVRLVYRIFFNHLLFDMKHYACKTIVYIFCFGVGTNSTTNRLIFSISSRCIFNGSHAPEARKS